MIPGGWLFPTSASPKSWIPAFMPGRWRRVTGGRDHERHA